MNGGTDTRGGNYVGGAIWMDPDWWCRARLSSSDNHKNGLFVQMLKATPVYIFFIMWTSCVCANDDCVFLGCEGGGLVMSF